MRKFDSDLTVLAEQGYNGVANPHLYSSPAWYAHRIGEHLAATERLTVGANRPFGVRMGRGYRIHANGHLYRFDGHTSVTMTVVREK